MIIVWMVVVAFLNTPVPKQLMFFADFSRSRSCKVTDDNRLQGHIFNKKVSCQLIRIKSFSCNLVNTSSPGALNQLFRDANCHIAMGNISVVAFYWMHGHFKN